jgi:two-component system cell cycle sensor histidine kinase/response regulator CckA
MTNQLTEQHEQARRMEGIQRLAGGVAHDFNNILTIILGYSEMIGGDETASEKVRQDARAVVEATARATALTRQLLQFSRRQDVPRQTVSVRDILVSLEPLLRQSMPENIALRVTPADDSLFTRIDPGQLQQVVVSLAANARDAMPRGGVLSIRAQQRDIAAEGQTIPPGSYVLVDVTDTGVGMSDYTRERAFEPFFTTKAKGAGTGFGLATVYAIVTHSDGYVSVSSAPGGGSTFSVYLRRHTG